MPPPWTIALAVDFGAASRRALQATLALATDLKARVVLVHAYGTPQAQGDAMTGAVLDAPLRTGAEDALEEVVALTNGWAAELRDGGLDVLTVAGEGPAARLVLGTVASEGAALVVVGTHGRSARRPFGLGSVARELVRTSPVPVLVVPGGAP